VQKQTAEIFSKEAFQVVLKLMTVIYYLRQFTQIKKKQEEVVSYILTQEVIS